MLISQPGPQEHMKPVGVFTVNSPPLPPSNPPWSRLSIGNPAVNTSVIRWGDMERENDVRQHSLSPMFKKRLR